MTTTLDSSFLRAVVLMTGFKRGPMLTAQAALLTIGLGCDTFTAAQLPGEVCNGSRHIAGAATGALVAQGMLEVVGRVKSPNENAKGRRVDLLRVAKRETAKTWLVRNGFEIPQEMQTQLPM